MNLKLSPHDRRVLLIGAVVVGVLAVGRLAVLPWLDGWTGARQRTVDSGAELTRLQTQLARLVGQRQRLCDQLGSAVGKSLQDVESARVSLLESSQSAMRSGGFNVTDFQPQKPRRLSGLSGVQEVSLQVRGKCNPEQLGKCLAAFCKTPSLVIVRQISLDNDEKKPGELSVTMMLTTLARAEGRS